MKSSNYINKQLFILIFISIMFFTLILYKKYLDKKTQELISYTCENGTEFIAQLNTNKELVVENERYKLESTPDKVKTYGNKSYSYTFVEGDLNSVIVTNRKGPNSTMCFKTKK